jgi:hypothetical protein
MGEIREYATVLFKLEADQYEELHNTGHYADWLFRLADRVVGIVLKALERLNDGGPSVMLLEFHGLSLSVIAQELKELLQETAHHYQMGTVQVQNPLPLPDPKISNTSSSEGPATDATPVGNRERIDGFILKMAKSGLKIKRNDIWHAAGYKDRTEFERFQRDERRNQTALSNFNRILSLNAEDLRELITKNNRKTL